MPVTMPFEENGVKVHFPDANHFRLSDCTAHQAIKGNGVKEMDIGWYDSASDTLWLVEMKGYYHPANPRHQPKDLSKTGIVEAVLEELLAKSIHTVCQVTTDRAGTMSCVGQPVTDRTAIKLVHLIKVMPGQEVYLGPMLDDIRAKLKPYIDIYNLDAVTVIDYDDAVATGSLTWIV